MDDGPEIHQPNLPEHYNPGPEKELHAYPQSTRLLPDQDSQSEANLKHEANLKDRREDNSSRDGLNISNLWLPMTIAFVTAAIVGVAVGGGLGSRLRESQRELHACRVRLTKASSNSTIGPAHSSATSSTTPPTTTSATATATTTGGLLVNYSMPEVNTIYSVALDCPALDNEDYTTSSGQVFTISCSTGLHGGDLVSMRAYTLYDCIEACGNMNHYAGSNASCESLEFQAQIATLGGDLDAYSNCWLKTNNTSVKPAGQITAGLSASARLTG